MTDLRLGDCLDVLRTLPDGSVDAVITDPPYGIVNKYHSQKRPSGTRRLSFRWDQDENIHDVVRIGVGLALTRLRKPGAAFVFCGLDTVESVQGEFRIAGLTPKPYAWVKLYPPPPMPGNWWTSAFELGVYGLHRGAWFGDKNVKRSNVYHGDSLRNGIREKNGHPTQKPIHIMEHLVSSLCPPGGTVLDPFMGSGTTGLACLNTGRNFIGVECDPAYFVIAEARIAVAKAAYALFDSIDAKAST